MNQKINYLPKGTTKVETISKLGRPFKIYRKNNADYWLYRFSVDGKSYTKSVIFKGGEVVRKGKLERYPPRPSAKELLQDSENFNDYKEAVKKMKERK